MLRRRDPAARDLLYEVVALIKNVAASFHELVCVRRVRDVVDGEDENFRDVAGRCLVFVGVFRDSFDDLAITVRRSDVALHRVRVELADFPWRLKGTEPLVDTLFAGLPLGLVHGARFYRVRSADGRRIRWLVR